MRTQTKCTLALLGMFIVEIFPLPFTALFSLYSVRKRPSWLPGLVDGLYADKPGNEEQGEQIKLSVQDYKVTQTKCTITLTLMLLIDIIVPFTIPFGLFVVRKRPWWFKQTVANLYSDQSDLASSQADSDNHETIELMEKRLVELECSNVDFAQSIGKKGKLL